MQFDLFFSSSVPQDGQMLLFENICLLILKYEN